MNKTDQKVKSHSDSFTNLEYKAINHPNDTHKKSSKLEGIRQRI